MGQGQLAASSRGLRTRPARLAALALAAAGSVALSGCGSGGDSAGDPGTVKAGGGPTPSATASASPVTSGGTSGASVLAAAYRKTNAAGTARMTFDETARATAGGRSETIHATGQGIGDLSGQRMRATLTTQGQQIEMIMASFVEYLHPTPTPSDLPPGKSWLRLDMNALTTARYGTSLSSLQDGGAGQFTQLLAYLRAVGAPPRTVGTDLVHGARSTHYAVTVDLNKVAAQRPAAQRGAIRTLIGQLGGPLMPLDVWVDDSGRVDQVREQMTVKTPTSSSAGTMSVAMDITVSYYDFGVALPDLSPPPAAEVQDITQDAVGSQHS